MKNHIKKSDPVRLSKEELRKSRAGLLGRFPSEDLYYPEPKMENDVCSKGLKEKKSSDKK
jgi:hypothetical protein